MFRTLLPFLLAIALPAHAGGPEDTARAYIDVFNTAEFDGLEALVTDDYRGQTMAAGQPVAEGPDGLRAWVTGVHERLPATKTIASIARDGNTVVVEVALSAPHPRGGEPIRARQVHWLTLEKGKIASDRVFFDMNTVLAQLEDER